MTIRIRAAAASFLLSASPALAEVGLPNAHGEPSIEKVKQTAKDTGKGGVDTGAGHTGVDTGVDAAAEKAAGALGGSAR